MDIILWNFFILYQIFFSQVKRNMIIINKHDIYKLPHELPSDLKKLPRDLRKLGKSQNFIEL